MRKVFSMILSDKTFSIYPSKELTDEIANFLKNSGYCKLTTVNPDFGLGSVAAHTLPMDIYSRPIGHIEGEIVSRSISENDLADLISNKFDVKVLI